MYICCSVCTVYVYSRIIYGNVRPSTPNERITRFNTPLEKTIDFNFIRYTILFSVGDGGAY